MQYWRFCDYLKMYQTGEFVFNNIFNIRIMVAKSKFAFYGANGTYLHETPFTVDVCGIRGTLHNAFDSFDRTRKSCGRADSVLDSPVVGPEFAFLGVPLTFYRATHCMLSR